MIKSIAERFTPQTAGMEHSFIREILKVTKGIPGIISFAGGLPSPLSFPKEQLAGLFAEVVRDEGDDVLQYGASDGDRLFKKAVADFEEVGWLTEEEMIVTLGTTNAIYFFTRCLTGPGDVIVCEAPSFPGALSAMQACGARMAGVPMDEWGIEPRQLRQTLIRLREENEPVKFMYLIPEFQNPSGKTMSLERRHEILKIALEFDLPILEDLPYRELRYTGERLPSLWELSRKQYKDQELVTSAKSFSKILGPGLRLGVAVGPPAIIGKMVMWAQKCTVSPDCVSQRAAARFIERGYLRDHMNRVIGLYRPRLQTMLDSLQEFMPPGVYWTKPEGGMFIWLTLPRQADTDRLFERAIENKVAFIPGSKFYPEGLTRKNELRLNFSYASEEQIREGIKRLARLL